MLNIQNETLMYGLTENYYSLWLKNDRPDLSSERAPHNWGGIIGIQIPMMTKKNWSRVPDGVQISG
jgi:hypothetical protein